MVKVNLQYYAGKVLKQFIKHYVARRFPSDQITDMVFHQDKSSSHALKYTLTSNCIYVSEKWTLLHLRSGCLKVQMLPKLILLPKESL